MGNGWCCPPASPCGTLEERSGLLRDDSKATTAAAGVEVVGVFQNSPEADADDAMKISDEITLKEEEEVKQSAEAAETETVNTQENGRIQQAEPKRTATPSPSTEPELRANATVRVHEEEEEEEEEKDVKETSVESRRADPPPCTLVSPQTEQTAAHQEAFAAADVVPEEQQPATVQEKIPKASAPRAAEGICPETPSCSEAETLKEHRTQDTAQGEAAHSAEVPETTAGEPSGERPPSVPNAEVSVAVCQGASTNQEVNAESPSHAVQNEIGSSSAHAEVAPADIKADVDAESGAGPEPTGLSHSGVEGNSFRERSTTAPAESSQSQMSDEDGEPDPESTAIGSEVSTLGSVTHEKVSEEHGKNNEMPKAGEDEKKTDNLTSTEVYEEERNQERRGAEEVAESGSADVEAEVIPVKEKEDSGKESFQNSEEDLYRGVEELSMTSAPQLEITLPKVEDRCSLNPAVDILSYSEREWKGNTAKSALIRKGYKEMSQRFSSLRRVRGDNYCALRATLFQVLSHSTQLPAWLQQEDIGAMLPKEVEGLISQWTFPGECQQGEGTGDATLQLQGYMELLRDRWQAAVGCSSTAERQQLCDGVFQGGEEELGLLEALKLLMLGRAVELHSCMQAGGDVPLFCWLLFARDSSGCPRSFLSNHLSHVGLSAGLEQVEMFLLGYTLQCTIQVYRLYMADTEEFVTYYPDDHKDDWPAVCLVTEDDRHYNVPVVELPEELTASS